MIIDGIEYVKKSEQVFEIINETWEIGESYHIETVTKYYTGILIGVTDSALILKSAAWIANTGNFSDYAAGAAPSECEPFALDQRVIVMIGSTCAAVKRDICLELVR